MNNTFLYGENYPVTSMEEKSNEIILNIESKKTKCQCPLCKHKSSECHEYYIRTVQDTPIHNKTVWLKIKAHKYECINRNCKVKVFTEEIDFVRKHKVMTDFLVQFILGISIYLSSSCSSLVLSFLGVKVSADTIDNLIKKIEVKDNKEVEGIGIDDVAKRKGQSYATAIYDLEDHHLIALLDGRDANTVKEWLKEHPKVKKVARDRASEYATAINEILPNCIQVADRFHLFQNLIVYLKDIFYKEIPKKIFIKDGEILDSKIEKVPKYQNSINQEKLNSLKYDNSLPIDENGNAVTFDNRKRDFDSKQYKEQKERRIEKQKIIKKLRERLKTTDCHGKHALAKEFNISYSTLLKYSKMSDEEVESLSEIKKYKDRKSLLDNYRNIVYKMLIDNIPQEYILAYVLKEGYNGSISNLSDYITMVAKNNNISYKSKFPLRNTKMVYPDDIIIITRQELLKNLLTIDNKKKNNEIEKYLPIIEDKYPIIKTIKTIFTDFHDIIFGNDIELLDIFIELYKDNIPSFCNGLKKDIAAVRNAISSEINSGFVEGNNNKFKLIKRIVYGKQKLCNLFKKTYLCFLSTLDNFALEEIVSQILNS